jgi:hypothetical protein
VREQVCKDKHLSVLSLLLSYLIAVTRLSSGEIGLLELANVTSQFAQLFDFFLKNKTS